MGQMGGNKLPGNMWGNGTERNAQRRQRLNGPNGLFLHWEKDDQGPKKYIIFGLDKAGESLNREVSREDTLEEEPCRRERVNVNGR